LPMPAEIEAVSSLRRKTVGGPRLCGREGSSARKGILSNGEKKTRNNEAGPRN